MGWATYIKDDSLRMRALDVAACGSARRESAPDRRTPQKHCSGGGEGKRIWLTGWGLGEAMGSDDGGTAIMELVAEVEEETGDDGTGVGHGQR